ncbi:BQ2448_6677 [Microbotryum intermedium]|uniref:BQ2448_6677 protein n=1 Tax=Microbotryum intermedium TaxID=269621 RepID=A0A238FM58_9BASI|nr:BQ2448_6677 [Microbotryum intermedium]
MMNRGVTTLTPSPIFESLLRSPFLSPASPRIKPTPELFKGFPRVFITCRGIETFRH